MSNATITPTNTPNRRTRISRAVGLTLVAALAATACGSSQPDLASEAQILEAQTQEPATTVAIETAPTTIIEPAALPTPLRAISLVDTLEVVASPGSAEVVASLTDRTEFGSARVLMVEEVDGAWIRVQVPVRPNGTSGWVRSSDVSVEEIDARVEIDLATRTITTWLDGEVLVETSIAVGSDENPTPTGTFFITDKVDTTDDDGAYGPFALGLSAHSDTLSEFGGGDGQIGIHGTNAPASIGQAVSHGCVRLPNELIEVLATQLPLGTPVIVR